MTPHVFQLTIYRNGISPTLRREVSATRPPRGEIVAAFDGTGSGPWFPEPESLRRALPSRLQAALSRDTRGWREGLGINVLELSLWSTRNELLAHLVARLAAPQPSTSE